MTAGGLALLRLGVADLPRIECLEASAGWPLGGSPQQLVRSLEDPSMVALGLLPGGASGPEALAGYALVARLPFEAELQALLVREAWRGQGLATRLLAGVIGQAKAWGSERLLLEVRAGNEPALALYRRHGFREDGRRRGYYPPRTPGGECEDALLMSLAPSDADAAGD